MNEPSGHEVASPRVLVVIAVGLLAAGGCQRSAPPGEAAAPAPPGAMTPAPPAPPAVDATDAPPEGVLRAYVWACDDGRSLYMRNLYREHAIALDFHEGTKRLDLTVSASGARYATADESVVFWIKGSSATLEQRGSPPVTCSERRAESLREDARARGVVYRALGNEPGWTLEIGPGTRLEWITNYGAERHSFDGAAESTAPGEGGSRKFVASNGGESIEATLAREPCVDAGEVTHDHTAVVVFSGTTHRGCGSRLD